MKAIIQISIFFSVLITCKVFSQTPEIANELNQWNTDGNLVNENHFIGTQNDYPIKFKCNNIERLRIDPDGKVGIGLCNPTAKLDVLGNVVFRNNLSLTGINTSNNLNNSLLIIDSSGNVLKTTISEISEASYLTKYCSEGPIQSPTWTNGENKIFVACPQVNVGINTTTPRVNLDVLGTTYTKSLKIGGVDPLTSDVRFHMKATGNSSSLATQFLIESEQQELLNLNYQGLLISRSQIIDVNNTTTTPFIIKNPNQKLLQVDNDGLLHSRRIKVDADSWADFVFDDNYYLMPISELQLFIETNKHLPNVPSEKEVIENGVDLFEMNKILLQKVEELTKYLIIQQQEIDSLKEKK
jgi:hypothetical protein